MDLYKPHATFKESFPSIYQKNVPKYIYYMRFQAVLIHGSEYRYEPRCREI